MYKELRNGEVPRSELKKHTRHRSFEGFLSTIVAVLGFEIRLAQLLVGRVPRKVVVKALEVGPSNMIAMPPKELGIFRGNTIQNFIE